MSSIKYRHHGEAPACARRREAESNGGCGEPPPAHCVLVVVTASEAAYERSRFGGITLLGGVVLRGTTTEDPVCRWPFWRGAICFCRPVDARSRCRFRRLRERECWWVARLMEMPFLLVI